MVVLSRHFFARQKLRRLAVLSRFYRHPDMEVEEIWSERSFLSSFVVVVRLYFLFKVIFNLAVSFSGRIVIPILRLGSQFI